LFNVVKYKNILSNGFSIFHLYKNWFACMNLTNTCGFFACINSKKNKWNCIASSTIVIINKVILDLNCMYKDLAIVPNTYVGVWLFFYIAFSFCPCIFKEYFILEKYEHPKFWENKSPNFGTPTWESRGKVIFRCSPQG
jgi:hypothetical protein